MGRDTILFYRASDGALRTGRFRNGSFTARLTTRVANGYTHLAASCDTALLYDRRTGAALTAPIANGRIDLTRKRTPRLGKGCVQVESSCDTVVLLKPNQAGAVRPKVGRLEGGRFRDTSPGTTWGPTTHLAATADSLVAVDAPNRIGWWGTAIDGTVTSTGGAGDFAPFWDVIAGSPDTLLFYDREGRLGAVSLRSAGACVFLGALPAVPKRIRLIAAGR